MTTGNSWDPIEDDPDDDNQQQQAKPKSGLRAHADQVTRERDELKAKLEKLEQAERARNVKEAIKAKGFDPEVADLVPEGVASDAAELEKWLTAKEKLFKPRTSEPRTNNESDELSDDEDVLSDDMDAFGRMSRVSNSALSPTGRQDTMALIKSAKTRAELDDVMRKFGNSNIG